MLYDLAPEINGLASNHFFLSRLQALDWNNDSKTFLNCVHCRYMEGQDLFFFRFH